MNNELINKLVALKNQVQTWIARTDNPTVIASAQVIAENVDSILPALINTGISESQLYPSGLHEKFNALFESVDSADYAPPQQSREVMAQLSAELEGHIEWVKTVLSERVMVFNNAIREAGLSRLQIRYDCD